MEVFLPIAEVSVNLITIFSLSPLEYAVLIKSCLKVSNIIVRVIRIIVPAIAMPRMKLGMRKTLKCPSGLSENLMRSVGGCHCHQIDGYSIIRVATQKPGAAINTTETVRNI